MTQRWSSDALRRAPVVRIYDAGEQTVVLDAEGRGHRFDGDSAMVARVVLEYLVRPRTRADLLAHLEELSGAPLEDATVIDELVALLVGAGAVLRGSPSPRLVHAPGRRVVVGITGAIAAIHAPALVQMLVDAGERVRVAMTREALRFVRTEGLEALTHAPVVTDMWPAEQVVGVPHIELAQWADAMLVWPASATTIGRIAGGDFGSIVSAVALTTKAPVMVAPSMNPAMAASAAVQRNLLRLVADGFHVVHPNLAIEVADAPGERVPVLGGAPDPGVVLQLLDAMLRDRPRVRPSSAADWDAVYERDASGLAWHHEAADEDLLAITHATAGEVLDVGAGLGTDAVAIAALGRRVIATDVSRRAIERACARAPEANVIWLVDDITDSRIVGSFGVMIDRGCAHLLDDVGLRAYATTAARLLRPGGTLAIKALVGEAAPGLAVLDAVRVASAFSELTLERDEATTLPGPGVSPAARLFVLRRR